MIWWPALRLLGIKQPWRLEVRTANSNSISLKRLALALHEEVCIIYHKKYPPIRSFQTTSAHSATSATGGWPAWTECTYNRQRQRMVSKMEDSCKSHGIEYPKCSTVAHIPDASGNIRDPRQEHPKKGKALIPSYETLSRKTAWPLRRNRM